MSGFFARFGRSTNDSPDRPRWTKTLRSRASLSALMHREELKETTGARESPPMLSTTVKSKSWAGRPRADAITEGSDLLLPKDGLSSRSSSPSHQTDPEVSALSAATADGAPLVRYDKTPTAAATVGRSALGAAKRRSLSALHQAEKRIPRFTSLRGRTPSPSRVGLLSEESERPQSATPSVAPSVSDIIISTSPLLLPSTPTRGNKPPPYQELPPQKSAHHVSQHLLPPAQKQLPEPPLLSLDGTCDGGPSRSECGLSTVAGSLCAHEASGAYSCPIMRHFCRSTSNGRGKERIVSATYSMSDAETIVDEEAAAAYNATMGPRSAHDRKRADRARRYKEIVAPRKLESIVGLPVTLNYECEVQREGPKSWPWTEDINDWTKIQLKAWTEPPAPDLVGQSCRPALSTPASSASPSPRKKKSVYWADEVEEHNRRLAQKGVCILTSEKFVTALGSGVELEPDDEYNVVCDVEHGRNICQESLATSSLDKVAVAEEDLSSTQAAWWPAVPNSVDAQSSSSSSDTESEHPCGTPPIKEDMIQAPIIYCDAPSKKTDPSIPNDEFTIPKPSSRSTSRALSEISDNAQAPTKTHSVIPLAGSCSPKSPRARKMPKMASPNPSTIKLSDKSARSLSSHFQDENTPTPTATPLDTHRYISWGSMPASYGGVVTAQMRDAFRARMAADEHAGRAGESWMTMSVSRRRRGGLR
ncbi:MAG: hypothetical protein M1817_002898 [Caeruleum heppii]|nr:MAG: hypothetical protein M1817_002898 [Caeruleum heppii]